SCGDGSAYVPFGLRLAGTVLPMCLLGRLFGASCSCIVGTRLHFRAGCAETAWAKLKTCPQRVFSGVDRDFSGAGRGFSGAGRDFSGVAGTLRTLTTSGRAPTPTRSYRGAWT